MAITDPLEYDPGTNFFGERFMEENFDEMMVGLIARVNLLMQNGGGGSGVPGETPQLRVSAGWVQYKYPSQITWTDLFEIPQDGQPGNPGTNGTNGDDGDPGAPGKSAYQIALDNGFVGSEPAWLFSLKGEDGLDGDDGITPGTYVESINDESGAVILTPVKIGAASASDLNNVFGIATQADDRAQAAQQTANEAKGKADTALQPADTILIKGILNPGQLPTGPAGFYLQRVS